MDHITICVCTFRRPDLLRRLLHVLSRQRTDDRFRYSIVVADNDAGESAHQVVSEFASGSLVEVVYCVEPVQNFARVRNLALEHAEGNFIAFIDDDEVPIDDWLLLMLDTCKAYGVAGVLGPVLPHFDSPPPAWLTKAGFYDRPRHQTGFVMGWQEARTGNVLLQRRILDGIVEIFRPEFRMGGEDQDFFRRMMEAGCTFIWCDEAPVHETVPPHRWTRRFLLQRALLRGKLTIRHRRDRLRNVAKSIVAVPLYTVALPFLVLLGHHLFMKCLVRLCDHLGRLLTLLKLNPISKRCN